MCCLFLVFEGTDADIFNKNSVSCESEENNDPYKMKPRRAVSSPQCRTARLTGVLPAGSYPDHRAVDVFLS